MFQLFDVVESLKLEIYPREMIPGELGRSIQDQVFADVSLPIASRVDAAASKLVWINKGSQKSRRDFRHIVNRVSVNELKLLRQIVKQLNLETLMTEIMLETDEFER